MFTYRYRICFKYIVSSVQHPCNVGLMGPILQMSLERERDLPTVTPKVHDGTSGPLEGGSCVSAKPAGIRLLLQVIAHSQ